MNRLTIRLSETVVRVLDELIERGVIVNRAEGIRIAIREFYINHYGEKKDNERFSR